MVPITREARMGTPEVRASSPVARWSRCRRLRRISKAKKTMKAKIPIAGREIGTPPHRLSRNTED